MARLIPSYDRRPPLASAQRLLIKLWSDMVTISTSGSLGAVFARQRSMPQVLQAQCRC